MGAQPGAGAKVVKANVKAVAACVQPGRWKVDGVDNLYLQVTSATARSWLLRYTHAGKAREKGLGSLKAVTLAEARERAEDIMRAVRRGDDPLAPGAGQPVAAARPFRVAADDYIARKTPEWGEPKHPLQWRATLETYAHPKLGDLPCDRITTAMVLEALQPIWTTKTETAKRVLGRIREVLNSEYTLQGRRWPGWQNPAVWQGCLQHLLPAPSKVHKVEHFKAVHWRDAPAAHAKIAASRGNSAVALRFLALCAPRTKMVRLATWAEFDLDAGTWSVPPERFFGTDGDGDEDGGAEAARVRVLSGTKGRHITVPVTDAMAAVLAEALTLKRGRDVFVFPGQKPGRPISTMTMLTLQHRRGIDATIHGWRTTFKTWAMETRAESHDVIELSLGHRLPGGAVPNAYFDGEMLERRRVLLEKWAAYLTSSAAT